MHPVTTPAPSPRFRSFIASFDRLVDTHPDTRRLRDDGARLLAALVEHDDWLDADHAAPDPWRYRQVLLHLDARRRYSVVAFVWGPGQRTPIHDHTVWGLIGMLRGAEVSQGYRFVGADRLVPSGPPTSIERGRVEAVGPDVGDVHRVHNGFDDRVSISIHVYGGDIGAIERSIYFEDGSRQPFVSGYTPSSLPASDDIDMAHPSPPPDDPTPELDPHAVRAALLARREIALLDVREEDEFAQSHPLWAANLPLARIELDAWGRIPRRDTRIAVYGGTDGVDARLAATRLRTLGYTDVCLLVGGLQGWIDAGGEVFRDVNVPSKSFGEWLEHARQTPSLPAAEVHALIEGGADVVVLDTRRFDEYQAMSIPGAVSVPGAELVLRVRDLAPDPATQVIVNCAGRTRSLVGAQSLVNAGIPNPVAALRNGTIGWTLAGQKLDTGASRRPGPVSAAARAAARADARAVADRAGVLRLDASRLPGWSAAGRTVYRLDVRTPEEYAMGHLAGFRSAPGGQLVQETDVHAPVRGARLVLVDHDGTADGSPDAGVCAEMTASWLAQMGWEVAVLDVAGAGGLDRATGPDAPERPVPPPVRTVDPLTLADWLAGGDEQVQVLDVTTSANYVKGHVPGAWFVLRSQLAQAPKGLRASQRLVLTCTTGLLAPWAAQDLAALVPPGLARHIAVLEGGTAAWARAGLPTARGEERLASPRIDRYRRPYEGVDVPRAAMQAYLDWEFGLVAQLQRDGTHFFAPI